MSKQLSRLLVGGDRHRHQLRIIALNDEIVAWIEVKGEVQELRDTGYSLGPRTIFTADEQAGRSVSEVFESFCNQVEKLSNLSICTAAHLTLIAEQLKPHLSIPVAVSMPLKASENQAKNYLLRADSWYNAGTDYDGDVWLRVYIEQDTLGQDILCISSGYSTLGQHVGKEIGVSVRDTEELAKNLCQVFPYILSAEELVSGLSWNKSPEILYLETQPDGPHGTCQRLVLAAERAFWLCCNHEALSYEGSYYPGPRVRTDQGYSLDFYFPKEGKFWASAYSRW